MHPPCQLGRRKTCRDGETRGLSFGGVDNPLSKCCSANGAAKVSAGNLPSLSEFRKPETRKSLCLQETGKNRTPPIVISLPPPIADIILRRFRPLLQSPIDPSPVKVIGSFTGVERPAMRRFPSSQRSVETSRLSAANSPRRLRYRGVGVEPSFARSKSLTSTARLFGTMPEPNLRA
jgi:hypothetical protein